MPFWSDLLRSVTHLREDAPSLPPSDVGPGTARDEGQALGVRLPEERVRERLVGAVADRVPGPAPPHTPGSARTNGARADLAPVSDPGAARLDAIDEIGPWHARVFDLVSDGMVLFGAAGELAYRNAAAIAMTDDDGLPLLREARALALLVLARSGDRRAPSLVATRELTAGAVHFHLAGVCTPAALPPGSLPPAACEPAVLVTIARTSPPLPSPAVLRHQFQLTAREASVALLLAEGRSNAGVARRLGISANTVRHYIETVLLKLDVPSRAAVAAALLGVYERTDEHAVPRIARGRRPPDAD